VSKRREGPERAAREQPCDACETNHVPCETCPFVQFARPAAPPNEDEREHCERVAYEYYDARPANPETWQLPLLISRERDAARAEGEAYGRVLAEDADRAVGEILARLTELVEAAEGALHIGVNSEPAHALLIAAVAKAKAL
jgi:hypothetical protein